MKSIFPYISHTPKPFFPLLSLKTPKQNLNILSNDRKIGLESKKSWILADLS